MGKEWLKATAIKVAKTMAETAIGVIGSTALITEVNWAVVASAVALSGVMTVLFNIKILPE